MDLILITADPVRAGIAARAGVDRVMVDLEMTGKCERQGHLDTVISGHTLDDVRAVAAGLDGSELVVRIDPWSDDSREQVDRCIDSGAEIVMLPMFVGRDEVAQFVEAVAGRARTCLLLETPEAVSALDAILEVGNIDEVHVGLNDLHLALGQRFMFELVADGTVERIGNRVRQNGIKFGFGGVARIGGKPLDPKLVLSEHVRLGSSQVILSRDFQRTFDGPDPEKDLASAVRQVRDVVADLDSVSEDELGKNAVRLSEQVAELVASNGSS